MSACCFVVALLTCRQRRHNSRHESETRASAFMAFGLRPSAFGLRPSAFYCIFSITCSNFAAERENAFFTSMIWKSNFFRIVLGCTLLGIGLWYGQQWLGDRYAARPIWSLGVDTNAIQSLEWRQSGKSTWSLSKSERGWWITNGKSTFEVPADSVNVLLSGLDGWSTASYSPALPADWSQYGLTDFSPSLVVKSKKNERQFWFGRKVLPDGMVQMYLREEGRNDVLVGAPDLHWLPNAVRMFENKPLVNPVLATDIKAVSCFWGADTVVWTRRDSTWVSNYRDTVPRATIQNWLDSATVLRTGIFTESLVNAQEAFGQFSLDYGDDMKVILIVSPDIDRTDAVLVQSAVFPQMTFSNSKFELEGWFSTVFIAKKQRR
jgi:Domain of unknown function (DUF4340)